MKGIFLLVRKPTPPRYLCPQRPTGEATCRLNDESVHSYVPLLVRPWIIPATTSCHLGATCTLHMIRRFYWLVSDWCLVWYLQSMVASKLSEVLSTEIHAVAGPVAHHLDAPVSGEQQRYQRRPFRSSTEHTRGQHLHIALFCFLLLLPKYQPKVLPAS